MNEPRRTAWYVAVAWLALCTLGPFLVFTLSDTRLPNDHDDYYTWQIVDALEGAVQDPGPGRVLGTMDRAWHSGQPRPQGIEMVHAAILAFFGPSLLVYRLVNLPFLLLLVGATWAAGRMVLGRWGGLLAAFVVLQTQPELAPGEGPIVAVLEPTRELAVQARGVVRFALVKSPNDA